MQYILIFAMAIFLNGCAIFGDPTELDDTKGWSPKRIYEEASAKMRAQDFETAIRYFEKLESRYPNGVYAAQAQLEVAYAYYKRNDPVLCVASADRFIKLHPNHPNVDYAYYLKGLAIFTEPGLVERVTKQKISDRDPRAMRDAFITFKDLINRFPDSRYTNDARERMVYLTNSLSEHELFVARYYMNRKAYVAAVNRAKYVMENFPQAENQEEALIILISAYEYMSMQDLQKDALRVLAHNYPESEFLKPHGPKEKRKWWKVWDDFF